MWKNKAKGQIAIEFLVVVGIVMIFAFYFSAGFYSLLKSNEAIHLLKQDALDVIAKHNYPTTITKIDLTYYGTNNKDVNVDFYFNRNNGPVYDADFELFQTSTYQESINYIKKNSAYETITLNFSYE